MPWDNSLNPAKGRAFQEIAGVLLSARFGCALLLDHGVPIGRPSKIHRFDLASADLRFVGECKSYSWTETGNMPSAKMGFLNEAVLYLSHLPASVELRFIAMRMDRHAKKGSLSEYYIRTYRHLLGGLTIFEIDPLAGIVIEHRTESVSR